MASLHVSGLPNLPLVEERFVSVERWGETQLVVVHSLASSESIAEVNTVNIFTRQLMFGYLKTGFSGEYLHPRVMRMGSGEGSTIRNFLVSTVHLISSG